MTFSPIHQPSLFFTYFLLRLYPIVYHFNTFLSPVFSLHPSSQTNSGCVQWSAFWMPAEQAAEAKLHHKRVAPLLNGPEKHQQSDYISLVSVCPVYFQILLLFKPPRVHPVMRLSVSDFASYCTEKIESIMKELSLLILNMHTYCAPHPTPLSSHPNSGPISPSLCFRSQSRPPSQNLKTANYSFSLLYIYFLPVNKIIFMFL